MNELFIITFYPRNMILFIKHCYPIIIYFEIMSTYTHRRNQTVTFKIYLMKLLRTIQITLTAVSSMLFPLQDQDYIISRAKKKLKSQVANDLELC